MPKYNVSYEVEVEAESDRAAAIKAMSCMFNGEQTRILTVYLVGPADFASFDMNEIAVTEAKKHSGFPAN